MKNVLIALVVTSALFIWLFGWFGVGIVALFCLYAWASGRRRKKPGPVAGFIERLGVDDDEPTSR